MRVQWQVSGNHLAWTFEKYGVEKSISLAGTLASSEPSVQLLAVGQKLGLRCFLRSIVYLRSPLDVWTRCYPPDANPFEDRFCVTPSCGFSLPNAVPSSISSVDRFELDEAPFASAWDVSFGGVSSMPRAALELIIASTLWRPEVS